MKIDGPPSGVEIPSDFCFSSSMHSPKFPSKAADIKKAVDATQLLKLWKSTVRDRMRRQILPDPVEFLDFHVAAKQRCADIENAVVSGEYIPSRVVRIKSEKSKGLCRQLVLPSPPDALILQALSNSLWATIKSKAPSSNAFYAPQDQPFSKVTPKSEDDEWGYGPIESWLDFQETILRFSKTRKYVVVTDIANYYDFIIHGFLRSILADYTGEKEHALDLLLYILDSMLWRPDYMPNYGIGMPQMDLDAPRLLAHTHLFEIDALFAGDHAIDYARYMDDIDFGVDSIAKAKTVLRDLDLSLQTRNLRLNSGKTKILTFSAAAVHFRVKDNERFEKLQSRFTKKSKNVALMVRRQRVLQRIISRSVAEKYFEAGNGGKVLKRLINLGTKIGAHIDEVTLRKLLYEYPALMDTILRNSLNCGIILKHLTVFSGFLRSGESVDDVSKIIIATYTSSACSSVPVPSVQLSFFIDSFEKHEPFGLYARLWLISRFGTIDQLKNEIDSTNLVWSRHRHLSRLVAGFYGIFRLTPHFLSFRAFVAKWGGVESALIFDFHESVSDTKAGYKAVEKFILAANTTLPNEISHAKTLILASMLANPHVPKIDRAKLLASAGRMMADNYYLDRFSAIISAAP